MYSVWMAVESINVRYAQVAIFYSKLITYILTNYQIIGQENY